MQILAVSTSGAAATAALIQDGVCVLELAGDADKRHAETVLPMIEELLEKCGRTLTDMDLLAVDVGPGSFTGVRIGVSAVNALAFAAGKPVASVDALHILAESAVDADNPVCAAIDARNGNGYAALYRCGEVLRQPDAVVMDAYLSTLPAGAALLGDIGAPGWVHAVPTARLAGLAAYRLKLPGEKQAMPMYLRPSQAERMWKLRQEAKPDGL